jgi:hypothetical protein
MSRALKCLVQGGAGPESDKGVVLSLDCPAVRSLLDGGMIELLEPDEVDAYKSMFQVQGTQLSGHMMFELMFMYVHVEVSC